MTYKAYKSSNPSKLIDEYFEFKVSNKALPFQSIVLPLGKHSLAYTYKGENKLTVKFDGLAEIEDLNSDGSPEVLIYTKSDGSGSYGNVIGFSVNNKKSMSQIYFPPITDNKELSKGYMGHDEFTIIETTLAQRFPIYKESDSNANPTGGTRQVTYKLVDGEASRKFVVKNSTEFNTNN